MYVINKKPVLELYIQEISLEKSLKLRAGSLYQDVSIGDVFDCVIDLDTGSILKEIDIKVTSILFKGESESQLPKGRSGELGLGLCDKKIEWLKEILKTKKVLLSKKDNIELDIYSRDVISLEQTKNNAQVQRMLPRLGLELSNDRLLFIAKAIRDDVSLNDQFNLIWNMDSIEITENNPVRLEAIYSKSLQPEKILYRGVPTLVLLSKSNDDIQTEENSSLLNSLSNHLMIGKRVTLPDFIEDVEDLPS
jgi:hypothetical protein